MPPPRLLLGAALLFWGGMTGRPVPGLALAILVEAAHWTRIRWDFGERAHLRAWRLSVLLLVVVAVLTIMNGSRLDTMLRVFTWLPVIVLPLQFVQSYGLSRTMTLAVFSLMTRRRRAHASRHGLPFREVAFSFGNVYLAATLIASSVGRNSDASIFFPGLAILTAWALAAAVPGSWKRSLAVTLPILALAYAGGMLGQRGLTLLHRFATHGGLPHDDDRSLDRETTMGRLGELKQSPEIKWRLKPLQGKLPPLLRLASYSTPHATPIYSGWHNTHLPDSVALNDNSERSKYDLDFAELTVFGNPFRPEDPDDNFHLAAPEISALDAVDPRLNRFRLRGEIPNRSTLVPAPGSTTAFHRFAAQELQRSSYGTFRLTPLHPVVDTVVLWSDGISTEKPPWTSTQEGKGGKTIQPDLEIPKRLENTLATLADEIGIREGDLDERVMKLRVWFLRNFEYTRYNREPKGRRREGLSSLEIFLTETRAGHCEFFASATALLLREVDIPTRYTTGFAVVEYDPARQEALLRGTHAHAWCRAWDDTKRTWIDVDLTPPDWTGLETPRTARFQHLQDRLKFLREDLLVWRSQPGNMLLVTLALVLPLLVGLAFIFRNLWKSRRHVETRARGVMVRTPLSDLEKPARRVLGSRPPGTSLASWLRTLGPRLESDGDLEEALTLHQRLRFDPDGPSDSSFHPRLATLVANLKSRISRLPRAR